MEVKSVCQIFICLVMLLGCSSKYIEKRSDPIILLSLVKSSIFQKKVLPIDVRKLVTREIVEEAGDPIIFVELEDGRNATLSLFPGENELPVWLGVDGSTITAKNGVLISTRGMGDDLMHSEYEKTFWGLSNPGKQYAKKYTYLVEDNQLVSKYFNCSFNLDEKSSVIKIFDRDFSVSMRVETCTGQNTDFKNRYWIETDGTVRRSTQFHSNNVGQVLLEIL